MKYLGFIILLAFIQSTSAQIKITALDNKTIPRSIHYKGHIVNASQYGDTEGEHIIIATETGEVAVKVDGDDDSNRKAEVYAYDYKITNGQPILNWQMHDFTIVCPVDTKAKYVPNTFAITDLNKDGKAEVWLMYIIGCRGGVDPGSMKIIMHEGIKKYAIRGSSRVKVTDMDYSGGEFTMDEVFKAGPEAFRQYALQLWKKNMVEKGD